MIWLGVAWKFIVGVAKAIPWWGWFVAGCLFASFLYGESRYSAGQAERQALWDAATAEQEQRIRELQTKVDTATASVEVRTIEKVRTVHEKGDTIIRRIPQLVPVGSCDLPVGFRRVHDDASRNEVSDATASAD